MTDYRELKRQAAVDALNAPNVVGLDGEMSDLQDTLAAVGVKSK